MAKEKKNKAPIKVVDIDQNLATSMVPIGDILADADFNARKPDKETGEYRGVAELAKSIKAVGLLSPVGVKLLSDDERKTMDTDCRYLLVQGYQRLAAVKSLGQEQIKATILEATLGECERLNLIENIVRKDLEYWEMGDKFREMLQDDKNLNQSQLARDVGLDKSMVSNYVLLATKLSPQLQDKWRTKHGKATIPTLLECVRYGGGGEVPIDPERQYERWCTFALGLMNEDNTIDMEGVAKEMEKVGLKPPGAPKGDARKANGKGAKAPKLTRPTSAVIKEALEALNEYEGARSEEWQSGIRVALQFAMGAKPTIPGVFNPAESDAD